MGDLVLASGSPRRHELLTMIGVPHIIDIPEISEHLLPGEKPEEHTVRLAIEKATTVARSHPGRWVLGADTVVVLDDRILGKPRSPVEAERMLASLAGRRHEVVTAVALVRDAATVHRVSVSTVWIRALDEGLIRRYVATGEPMDKAGAYAVQGKGAILVDRIEGDFFTVMGLPIALVSQMLASVGVGPLQDRES